MKQPFLELLAVGGKSNSLGRSNEVIEAVLHDKSRLSELYDCLFAEDAWLRMRAADSLEKICRVHPDWLLDYVDRFSELTTSTQPSIQWHLAQIYRQVELTPAQKQFAIDWLKQLLASKEIDWIVVANAMDTLAAFTKDGSVPKLEALALFEIQRHHKSSAVVRRADKLINQL